MATPRLRLPYGPDIPLGVPSTESLVAAGLNVWTKLVNGHLADMTPMPRDRLHAAPQTTVYRYRANPEQQYDDSPPVLLVPPLAAPARCFDLRRSCSLVEHLVDGGRRTYLVDYGSIAFADRRLGLEHWIDNVIPDAIRIAADDAGEPVHLAAWCLGGIMSLLALAGQPDLPVASVTLVASPFDVTAVPFVAPLRPIALLTGGRVGTVAYRAMGGAPAFLVKRMFQLSSVDKYVTKPLAILTHLDDRDFLAQIEAVDDFTANMLAYPGRTFGQLYHRFFRANDLATGCLDIDGKRLSLDDVTVPVLAIGGTGDTIAPAAAVHHVGSLLPKSPEVRLETAPGGHLGVLTGRGARATTWALLDEWLDKQHAHGSAAGKTTLRSR